MTEDVYAEQRARMPNTPWQPLPVYLRPGFAQSLDKSRPHELVHKMHRGKIVPPAKCPDLTYRYLDTGETCIVPNIWYNQTKEMRENHWQWMVDWHETRLAGFVAARAKIGDRPANSYLISHARDLDREIEYQEKALRTAKACLADVAAGRRLI